MYRKTVDELQNDQREKLVIDIRSEEDYTKETYPGAKHIFWETFMDHIGEIPKDQPVYLFCYTGQFQTVSSTIDEKLLPSIVIAFSMVVP